MSFCEQCNELSCSLKCGKFHDQLISYWLLKKTGYVQENDINVDLKEIGWEGMDWINLAEDRGMR